MKVKPKFIVFISVLLIFIIYVAVGLKQQLEVTTYFYQNDKIPQEFDGYKIMQISDLHCKTFGSSQKDFIQLIQEYSPNLIVMTGDIVDEKHDNIQPVKDLLEGIPSSVPVYYVSGNHELDPDASLQYQQLKDLFVQYHVIDLDDKSTAIGIGNDKIYIHGRKYLSKYVTNDLEMADESVFNILLYHGSDNFDAISQFHYDLVLSGHAHGGIIRLPFVGGVFGNSGELFPKYDGGMFTAGNSTLISSRGLGESILPRFYNNPELVLIVLRAN